MKTPDILLCVQLNGGQAQVVLKRTMPSSCLHKHYKVNITHFLTSTFLLECIPLLLSRDNKIGETFANVKN